MPMLLLPIAIASIAAIAIVLAYAATRPDDFIVSRSATIKAPPERIFPLINDLHRFNEWNPFAKHDPSAQITYSGPPSGKGASHAWDGNRKAGKGSLEITDTAPPARVTMRLHIQKPMACANTLVFALQPKGGATEVSWTMTGKSQYIAKVMGVLFSMDKMVGGEFEKGLADLKTMVEK